MPTNSEVKGTYGSDEHPGWLIMVYLAGGRDVSDEARESLLRMKQVGSTDGVEIVAQFDSGSEGLSTKRYRLAPFSDAMELENFLTKACIEVPASNNPSDSSLANYYYGRLMMALDKSARDKIQSAHMQDDMLNLLRFYPDQFKSLFLDGILADDVVANLGDTNAGDPQVLVDFVKWALKTYDLNNDKKRMLIIWGHGDGLSVAWDFSALPGNLLGTAMTLNSLPDLISNNLKEFRRTGDHSYIDIVGFNSCSLGTIEVYTQLAGYVHYGIASEGYTLDSSWPYDRILQALIDKPDLRRDIKQFSERVVTEYIDYYQTSVITAELNRPGRSLESRLDFNMLKTHVLGQGNTKQSPQLGQGNTKTSPQMGSQVGPATTGIDLSVSELGKAKEVVTGVKTLVRALRDGIKRKDVQLLSAILAAHSVGQSYYNQDFTDLFDFCRALHEFYLDSDIQELCEAIATAIGNMCNSRHVGEDVKRSNGASVFFPWGDWGEQDAFKNYGELKFCESTEWHLFLKEYRAWVNEFEEGQSAFNKLRLKKLNAANASSSVTHKQKKLAAAAGSLPVAQKR